MPAKPKKSLRKNVSRSSQANSCATSSKHVHADVYQQTQTPAGETRAGDLFSDPRHRVTDPFDKFLIDVLGDDIEDAEVEEMIVTRERKEQDRAVRAKEKAAKAADDLAEAEAAARVQADRDAKESEYVAFIRAALNEQYRKDTGYDGEIAP